MLKQLEIFHINAFTSTAFQGNPAAVILSDSLSEVQMQMIARELNLSETAFLNQLSQNEFTLRWFTPTNEVMLCGHATIASLHYLKEKKLLHNNSSVIFKTKSGELVCGIDSGKYWMSIPKINFKKSLSIPEQILEYLGLSEEKLLSEIYLASNKYLFIGVDNIETLFNLNPDFRGLLSIIKSQNTFTDLTVFTPVSSNDSIAQMRFFAPFDGINEDPATGSAAGPLLKLLYELNLLKNFSDDKIYTIEQGKPLNRCSYIGASYNSRSDALKIYGEAITVLKGEFVI